MFFFGFVAFVAIAAAAVIGDTVMGAAVAGVFSVINTILLAVIHRRTQTIQGHQEDVRKALTSPRRIVYDAEGNPVGTVLDLHREGGWDNWLLQQNRRQNDPPDGSTL